MAASRRDPADARVSSREALRFRRGAGLGLAIARGIVEAQDGRIHLDSALGTGTTAWVELPLKR